MTIGAVLAFALTASAPSSAPRQPDLLGLPPLVTCTASSEAAKLGGMLFRDTRLSADRTVSCATCHQPEHAFVDGKPLAEGAGRQVGTRNTPTLINVGLHSAFAWDGRQDSLEGQVGDAFLNPREHGLLSHDFLLRRIKAHEGYVSAFVTIFGKRGGAEPISLHNVERVIACYIQSLAAGDSAFDRYMYRGLRSALTDAQQRGLRLFSDKGRCTACHPYGDHYAAFTDNRFHSIHIDSSALRALPEVLSVIISTPGEQLGTLILSHPQIAALGRFVVTRTPGDLGRFRTPSLRNVAITAPYLHDGSASTLASVVDREVYYRAAELGRPISLTPSERDDVVAFLESLTSSRYDTPHTAAR